MNKRVVSVMFLISICFILANSVSASHAQCHNTIDDDGDGQTDAFVLENVVTTDITGQFVAATQGAPGLLAVDTNDFSVGDDVSILNLAGTFIDPGERTGDCATDTGVINGMSAPLIRFYDSSQIGIGSVYEMKDFVNIKVPAGAASLRAYFTDSNLGDNTGGCNFDIRIMSATVCNDGIDNDGDTFADFPADSGCVSADDNSEEPHDPDCTDPNDNSESTGSPPLSSCDPSQTIMKLFQQSNSHGAPYDNTNYNIDICYSEIFGGDYLDPNPHDPNPSANPTNVVLRLFDILNSHAEAPDKSPPTYPIDVTYGDLVCHTVDTGAGESCGNNELIVASLFSDTNSHISKGDDPNLPYKICCKTNLIFPQCSDDFDNDFDLVYDFITDGDDDGISGQTDDGDLDCTSIDDPVEGPTQCSDGNDNDGDGLIDENDPDCTNPNDPIEGDNQCSDGNDNDGDGLIDACLLDGSNSATCDPDCNDITDPLEGPTQCNDGNDNDGDGLIDACLPDGSNADTCDPDCTDDNDPLEGPEPPIDFAEAYWANLLDEQISTASLGSTVKLIVGGIGLENEDISYVIKKQEGLFGLDWLWPDSVVAQLDSLGFLTWVAGSSEVNEPLEVGIYYFEATIVGETKSSLDTTDQDFDGYLTVAEGPDTPPGVTIQTPEDKQIYFKDELLNFRATVADPDDLILDWTWDLGEKDSNGDDVIMTGTIDTSQTNLIEFQYAYTTAAPKISVITVDDNRGGIGRNKSSMLAIASDFILAYIDNPVFGSIHTQEKIETNATSTYALTSDLNIDPDTNECTFNIECNAGSCPSSTKGNPNNIDPILLGCTYTGPNSVPVNNAPSCLTNPIPDCDYSDNAVFNWDQITFDWKFFDDKTGLEIENPKSDTGFTGVQFEQIFPKRGQYTLELTTTYDTSITSTTRTTFQVDIETIYPTCRTINDNFDKRFVTGSEIGESYWLVQSVPHRADDNTDDGSGFNNCYQADGVGVDINTQVSECCPNFRPKCNQGSGVCEFSNQIGCQQFSESNCNGHEDLAEDLWETLDENTRDVCVIQSSLEDSEICKTYNVCACVWDPNIGESGSCNLKYIKKSKDKEGNIITTANLPLECNIEPIVLEEDGVSCTIITLGTTGNCDPDGPGKIILEWEGRWEGGIKNLPAPDDCPESGTTVHQCEDILRLPFFNFINIIITILTIALVYLVSNKRRIGKYK